MTIRPLFPGHVLYLDLQKCVWPGFLNRPKCPGFGCFLNPAPWISDHCRLLPQHVFCSRDFRVHSFKHYNIVYNFGTSHMYLNIFEWAFARFTFTFDFAITICVKEAHLTRSDICQWAQDLLSCKYSSMVFSVISPYSWPVISQIWLLQLLIAKSAFFPQNLAAFKLLPWVDFPKWVKGLKYYIWLKC